MTSGNGHNSALCTDCPVLPTETDHNKETLQSGLRTRRDVTPGLIVDSVGVLSGRAAAALERG